MSLLEIFTGFVDHIDGETAFVTLTTEDGEQLSGEYSAIEFAELGIRERRRFTCQTVMVDGVPFDPGDLFTEYYYPGCWYNVFHIADPEGRSKGWYCNVTRPPDLTADTISYIDLALDLFVHPDGRYSVLDEDEFAEASAGIYDATDVEQARRGLEALILLVRQGELPAPGQ